MKNWVPISRKIGSLFQEKLGPYFKKKLGPYPNAWGSLKKVATSAHNWLYFPRNILQFYLGLKFYSEKWIFFRIVGKIDGNYEENIGGLAGPLSGIFSHWNWHFKQNKVTEALYVQGNSNIMGYV